MGTCDTVVARPCAACGTPMGSSRMCSVSRALPSEAEDCATACLPSSPLSPEILSNSSQAPDLLGLVGGRGQLPHRSEVGSLMPCAPSWKYAGQLTTSAQRKAQIPGMYVCIYFSWYLELKPEPQACQAGAMPLSCPWYLLSAASI